MQRVIQRLSMLFARSTTRRGLLSSIARGAVGAGLGAGFLFSGGAAFALAAPPCTPKTDNGCSGGTIWCTSMGDVNGCYMGNPVPYCGDCAYDNKGNVVGCSTSGGNSKDHGSWTCCCNGELSECTDCGLQGQSFQCICNSKRGPC